MSNSEVADYAPIPSGALPAEGGTRSAVLGPQGQPLAAVVREVPLPAAQPPRYHYTLRPAPPSFHIFEETTGRRITTFPIPGQAQAEDLADRYNREQAAP